MTKATATRGKLSTVLSLFFLLSCVESLLPADAASLCYSFTVDNPVPRQWSYEVQGQLNKETFLSYSGNNSYHVFDVLGNRLNVTKIWEPQFVDTLIDGVDMFQQQMIHMKKENNSIREPLTVQATMCCWHEIDGHFNGSWDFDLNGHKMFHVDAITGQWTEVDPVSRWMKEMWEKNRDMARFLKMTSQGDCCSGLEAIKSHREEKLESTASPTTKPDVDQSSSTARNRSAFVLLLTIALLVLLQYLQ